MEVLLSWVFSWEVGSNTTHCEQEVGIQCWGLVGTVVAGHRGEKRLIFKAVSCQQ